MVGGGRCWVGLTNDGFIGWVGLSVQQFSSNLVTLQDPVAKLSICNQDCTDRFAYLYCDALTLFQ